VVVRARQTAMPPRFSGGSHKGRDQVTTPTKEQVITAVEAEIDPSTPEKKMRIPFPYQYDLAM
jgi:hypothetical protein